LALLYYSLFDGKKREKEEFFPSPTVQTQSS
jgi:hypothetical protein